MKRKVREPVVPAERHETVRQEIISLLGTGTFSARDVSGSVHASEKEVYAHLDHIKQTIKGHERKLIVTPAECKKCGFVFTKMERFKRPGKCPVCRGESIHEPLFSITEEGVKRP